MSSSTKFPKALSAMLLRCRRNVVFDRRTGEPLGIFLHARPAPDSLFGRLQPQPRMLQPVEAQAAPRKSRLESLPAARQPRHRLHHLPDRWPKPIHPRLRG